MSKSLQAALVLVTTPIGNENDITLSALNFLKNSKIIYCEDTRKSKDLLKRLDIDYSNKYINSFHDHSSQSLLEKICQESKENLVCYLSDAGSPLISDPAYPLIKKAIELEVNLQSASGISSLIYALELSGLPSNPFSFHGFIGRSVKDIKTFSETVKSQYGTHIFFEGVSRVEKTLDQLCLELGSLDFVVARELTKTFEEVHRFKGENFSTIKKDFVFKGEFVILIHNPNSTKMSSSELVDLANDVIDSGAKGKSLAKLLAKITNQNTKDIYSKLIR